VKRYYFRFVFPGGREVVAFTTSEDRADKLRKHTWTTNATTYLTPPLTRVDKDGLAAEDVSYRANLVHVEDIDHWTSTLGGAL
jgi:hypothetical protein